MPGRRARGTGLRRLEYVFDVPTEGLGQDGAKNVLPFFRGLSNGLRGPLQGIAGFVELLIGLKKGGVVHGTNVHRSVDDE